MKIKTRNRLTLNDLFRCWNGIGHNTEENIELTESRKRSLANLQPPWPKGVCQNPGGRPRKPITEAYADMADQKFPGDPKGRTYAQLAAEGQFNAAIKGKTDAAREIADRLEGKAVQPISGDISSGMSVTVNIEVAREKLFGD
jgi:hypothetical protein